MSEFCPKCAEWLGRSPHHLCPPHYECVAVDDNGRSARTIYARGGHGDAAEKYLRDLCNRDCEVFRDDDSIVVTTVAQSGVVRVFRVQMALRQTFSADEV